MDREANHFSEYPRKARRVVFAECCSDIMFVLVSNVASLGLYRSVLNGTAHGVDHAADPMRTRVAGALHDMPAMNGDGRCARNPEPATNDGSWPITAPTRSLAEGPLLEEVGKSMNGGTPRGVPQPARERFPFRVILRRTLCRNQYNMVKLPDLVAQGFVGGMAGARHRRLTGLSTSININGRSGFQNKPSDWEYAPPEGNGATLIKMMCPSQ